MTDRRTKMVERVRSLLAKAASSEFTSEAEAFEEKALSIMAEYEIAERELIDVRSVLDRTIIDLSHFKNGAWGAMELVGRLHTLFGGAYGVLQYTDDLTGKRVYQAHVWSTPAAHEQAMLLAEHLLPQLRADMSRDKPRSRKTYSIAWAFRVHDRLSEAQERVYSRSQALVPTTDAADAERDKHCRDREHSFRPDLLSGLAGDRAGSEADLNQQRITA